MSTPPAPPQPAVPIQRPATMKEVHHFYLGRMEQQLDAMRSMRTLNREAIQKQLEELSWLVKLYDTMLYRDYYQKFHQVFETPAAPSKRRQELLRQKAGQRAKQRYAEMLQQVKEAPEEVLALDLMQPENMVERFFAQEKLSHSVWFNGQWVFGDPAEPMPSVMAADSKPENAACAAPYITSAC